MNRNRVKEAPEAVVSKRKFATRSGAKDIFVTKLSGPMAERGAIASSEEAAEATLAAPAAADVAA